VTLCRHSVVRPGGPTLAQHLLHFDQSANEVLQLFYGRELEAADQWWTHASWYERKLPAAQRLQQQAVESRDRQRTEHDKLRQALGAWPVRPSEDLERNEDDWSYYAALPVAWYTIPFGIYVKVRKAVDSDFRAKIERLRRNVWFLQWRDQKLAEATALVKLFAREARKEPGEFCCLSSSRVYSTIAALRRRLVLFADSMRSLEASISPLPSVRPSMPAASFAEPKVDDCVDAQDAVGCWWPAKVPAESSLWCHYRLCGQVAIVDHGGLRATACCFRASLDHFTSLCDGCQGDVRGTIVDVPGNSEGQCDQHHGSFRFLVRALVGV